MSSIVEQAKKIVAANGLSDKVVLVRGKMEEVVLPFSGERRLVVQRKEENGGHLTFEGSAQLRAAFASGALHPGDFKPSVRDAVDAVLERVMRMFHAELVGHTLSASRARLMSEVEGLDLESRELAASALAETDTDTAEQAVVVEGRTHLVERAPDGLSLSEVLRSLEDKRLLLHVLDDMLAQQGPQVVLGTESRDLGLERCTVVAAPYFVGGARAGAVALLGPHRLEYARLVPLVNYTADSISGMLRGVPSAA
jgi:heat-inducible transcriptional repressor